MEQRSGAEIAVIGMAGRFPGAASVDELWRNLVAGVEGIARLTEDELLAGGVAPELLVRPDYVRARGVLAGVELFDAAFFDVAPREAEVLDPQHRLFLECAWEALETAGYGPGPAPGTRQEAPPAIGVFAGCSFNNYLVQYLLTRPDVLDAAGELQTVLGSDKDFLATRVSYKLDLSGPSLTVQTGCSTSLVAIHLACQSLLAGECDMALAGGVAVRLPQIAGYVHQEGGTLSADGRCASFDEAATGAVPGSGAGVVVLKPLADALADGDTVLAVVKGSAVNNDGAARVGFTAPGVVGQTRVLQAALGVAEVDPGTIGLIEGHGSATPLGDRIEVAALHRVFQGASEGRFCALGSVKSAVGHLDAAAGVAGFLKAVLALVHRTLPPNPHHARPNEELARGDSPFYVNPEALPWPRRGAPRRAGVSSFGLGGTNAHVVLEEAPEAPPADPSRPWHLLLLSARTGTALDEASDRLAGWLAAHPGLELADVAFTLAVGRGRFAARRALVCRDRDEARAALSAVRGDAALYAGGRWLGRAEVQSREPGMPLPGDPELAAGELAGLAPAEVWERLAGPSSGEEGRPALLEALGRLWLSGVEPWWEGLFGGEARRRVPLPSYPFERQRYWVEPGVPARSETGPADAAAHPVPAPSLQVTARHPRRLTRPYAAPRDETERAIAGIWEEVFDVAPIGVHDPFAELGGHSLLATQVQSRLRDRLAIELPLAALLEAPTVAQIAELVARKRVEEVDAARLDELLAGLEQLSDEEARRLLGDGG